MVNDGGQSWWSSSSSSAVVVIDGGRGRGYGRRSSAMVVCHRSSVVVVGQSSIVVIVISRRCGLKKSMVSEPWTCLNCDQPERMFSEYETLERIINCRDEQTYKHSAGYLHVRSLALL